MNASSIITAGLKTCTTKSLHQIDPNLHSRPCNEVIKDFPCNARDINIPHPPFQRATKAGLNGSRTIFFQQQTQYFTPLKRYLHLGERSFNAQLSNLATNLAAWLAGAAPCLKEKGATKM